MSKIPKHILEELKEVANKLPTYEEISYTKQKVIGNDINLKGAHTKLSNIDRNKEYIGTKNTGRDITPERHLKRLKKAYKKKGDNGVFEYIRKHSKTQRKYFTFWEFIKFYIFRIKPKGYLTRK